MDEIIKDIENLAPITTENIDFKNWPLDLLADYILKIHHRNIRKNGPKIQELLDKVCKVHGENHPALYNVQVLLRQSLSDLNQHLDKGELVLFPYIYETATNWYYNNSKRLKPPCISTSIWKTTSFSRVPYNWKRNYKSIHDANQNQTSI